jgi:hypothetical protein
MVVKNIAPMREPEGLKSPLGAMFLRFQWSLVSL